jgi:anti-sigma factor RsiW
MAHVDKDLSAYIAKELDPARCRTIENHLADCLQCSEVFRELQKLDALLSQTGDLSPRPDFAQKVMARIDAPQKVTLFGRRRPLAILAFAAAVMFIVLILALRNPEPNPIANRLKKTVTPAVSQQKQVPDAEMIAHLDELQNMEVIRQLDDLQSLDAVLVMDQKEIEK